MADFRTIALIFAIGMLADFLYRAFYGGSEEVDSTPPLTDDVNTTGFTAEKQEEPLYPSTDSFGDAHDHFDEIVDPQNYEHRKGKKNGKGTNLIYI